MSYSEEYSSSALSSSQVSSALSIEQEKIRINREFELALIKQLRGYSSISGLTMPSGSEASSLLQKEFFLQYFLPYEDRARGLSGDMAQKMTVGDSEYSSAGVYKGKFAVDFARALIYSMASQKPTFFRDKIAYLSGILGKSNTDEVKIGDYTMRFMNTDEYKSGLPLFLGDTLKTCQTVGKSGGKYALDSYLNPNVHNILITKKITLSDGRTIDIIVGSCVFWLSEDKTKAVICSLETNGADSNVSKYLLQAMACKIYTGMKEANPDFDCVEIGLGGGTLKNLGFHDCVDSKKGEKTPQTLFDKIRSQSISSQELGEFAGKLKKRGNGMELGGFLYTPDHEDMRMLGDTIGHSRDSRFRMKLVDKTNIQSLQENVEKCKTSLEKIQSDKQRRTSDRRHYVGYPHGSETFSRALYDDQRSERRSGFYSGKVYW